MKIGKIVYGFHEAGEPETSRTPIQSFTAEMVGRAASSRWVEAKAFICADAAVAYLEHIEVHWGDGGIAIVTCETCKKLWAELEAAAAAYRSSYE